MQFIFYGEDEWKRTTNVKPGECSILTMSGCLIRLPPIALPDRQQIDYFKDVIPHYRTGRYNDHVKVYDLFRATWHTHILDEHNAYESEQDILLKAYSHLVLELTQYENRQLMDQIKELRKRVVALESNFAHVREKSKMLDELLQDIK